LLVEYIVLNILKEMRETIKTTLPKERKFGLDLLRAMAIFFVVYGHGLQYLHRHISNDILKLLRFDGVMMFFVLSGFLIGQIIIKIYERESKLSFGVLLNFWMRRWLRTLPVYYLSLVAYTLFFAYIVKSVTLEEANILGFITFTQNLVTEHPRFFQVAWSLSIEEWFYLLTPLALFIVNLFSNHKKNNLLFIIIGFIVASLAIRYYELSKYETHIYTDLSPLLKKAVIFRLDSIMIGVFAAYLKSYYQSFWHKYTYHFLVLGIIIVIGYKIYLLNHIMRSHTYFHFLFGNHFLGIGIMLLLPYLDIMKMKNNWFKKIILHISLISYSLYLIHMLSIQFSSYFFPLPIANPVLAFANYFFYWALSIGVATALYFLFEKPILKWRDKKIPDTKSPSKT